MKQAILLFLATMLCFLIVGCGDDEKDDNQDTSDTTSDAGADAAAE